MSDTTRDPIIASRQPLPWVSWQRSEDYYSEGQLLWLEIDTLIRDRTQGEKSLDDFARDFFGSYAGATSTYRFEDVLAALSALLDHDWKGLLMARLDRREERAHLEGLGQGGYRLVYKTSPTAFANAADALDDLVNLRFSLGLAVSSSGLIQEVLWESPAFDANLTAGASILAVNGRDFSISELWRAVETAASGNPVRLHVKRGSHHFDVAVSYVGGHRFPHLERIDGAQAWLDEILTPR